MCTNVSLFIQKIAFINLIYRNKSIKSPFNMYPCGLLLPGKYPPSPRGTHIGRWYGRTGCASLKPPPPPFFRPHFSSRDPTSIF